MQIDDSSSPPNSRNFSLHQHLGRATFTLAPKASSSLGPRCRWSWPCNHWEFTFPTRRSVKPWWRKVAVVWWRKVVGQWFFMVFCCWKMLETQRFAKCDTGSTGFQRLARLARLQASPGVAFHIFDFDLLGCPRDRQLRVTLQSGCVLIFCFSDCKHSPWKHIIAHTQTIYCNPSCVSWVSLCILWL